MKRKNSKRRATAERTASARARALRVLRAVRAGKSLTAASRAEHIKPSTVRRHIGSALRQDKPNGRFRASTKDRFRRQLQVLSPQGPVPVSAKNIAEAREYSRYLNAVGHFTRTGDASKLRPFDGRSFIDETGELQPFVTDDHLIIKLALADELVLDSLYRALPRR